jgi:hypothetical protein
MRQSTKLFGSAAMFILASMHDASAFSANFSWAGIRPCGRKSPAFTIHDAPKETESLHFIMSDKDAPHFQHRGSTVPYNGDGRVPEGAIDYIGRCPPERLCDFDPLVTDADKRCRQAGASAGRFSRPARSRGLRLVS